MSFTYSRRGFGFGLVRVINLEPQYLAFHIIHP